MRSEKGHPSLEYMSRMSAGSIETGSIETVQHSTHVYGRRSDRSWPFIQFLSKAYDQSRSAEHWPECSRGRVVHSGSDLSRHLCGGVYCVWGFRSILPKTLAVQIPLSLLPLTPITERLPRPTWIQLVAVWNNLMRIFIFYIPFTWVVCLDLPVIFQTDLKGYPMSNLWSCGVDLLKSGALRIYAW